MPPSIPIPSRHAAPQRPHALRRDIQGLRALAVVAVILDHLIGWPVGGFVGVDVFFVVSGFLITGLLLRSIERDGRVPFAEFYRRRVKRILPAALLVLASGTGAAAWLFPAGRFAQAATDALWAALFSANWRFAAVGTDYFAAAGPRSPFQHYWSLGVEEQFYLVWPWLLLLAVALSRRLTPPRRRLAIALVIAGPTAVSFAWSLAETAARPTPAYFDTASRGWELGVGALLAVATPALERLRPGLRPPLAWLGLALIGASLAVITGAAAFPAPAALLPVAGAGLVVAAGTGEEPRLVRVLTNPLATWLGDRSYSLYLWHLPVIVLLGPLLPAGPLRTAACAALLLLLAVTAYALVEDPIRRSHLFEPRASASSVTRRPRRRGALTALSLGAVGVAVGVTVIPALTLPPHAVAKAAPSERATASPSPLAAGASPTPIAAPDALPALQRQIRAALSARSWPALSPDVAADGAATRVPEWTRDGCLTVTERTLAHCTWGAAGATRTAVVLGDSIALSWLPAIRGALEPEGYRVVALDMAQCPAAALAMTDWDSRGDFATRCSRHTAWTVRMIRSLHPDLVLASSAPSTQWRLRDGASGAAAMAEWERGQQQLFRTVVPLARTVAVLDPPPPGKSLQECQTRFSSPADCAGPLPGYLPPFTDASTRAASATGAHHVATKAWFCSAGRCPAYVGRTPVFADGQHLTAAYSKRLAPLVAQALEAMPRE